MEELKILWIDDAIKKPELVSDLYALEKKGYTITPIDKTSDLRITKKELQQYKCIILDLNMPPGRYKTKNNTLGGTSIGYSILLKIKKICPDSKVIVYSNHDALEVREHCKETNIEYWIKSDVSSELFADNIDKYINK